MVLKNRKSPRLQDRDYRRVGGYFITICTKNREYYFGKVKDGKMVLNELGKNAWKCREEIPNHYPFVTIDEFICMPNHIHGILMIGEFVGTQYFAS